jgi:Tfp pilus assembly protein PilO
MEKMRQWVMLTAVGVVAILALGWFLLVSPQHSHVSSLRTQTTAAQQHNQTLQMQVHQLQVEQKGMLAQQRKLATIATQIPDNPALPTLIRQLSTAAKSAGVELVSLAPTAPAPVAAAAPTAPRAVPTTGGVAAPAAPTAAAGASALQQISVALNVKGSYYNIENFFSAVEHLSRAMMVSTFTVAPLNSAAVSAPAPTAGTGSATTSAPTDLPGTLSAQITALVFEAPSVTAPVSTVTTTK